MPEKLTTASADCTTAEEEMSPLVWVPESCSNETVTGTTSQATAQPKVEAVTLMLTVQPGITACS